MSLSEEGIDHVHGSIKLSINSYITIIIVSITLLSITIAIVILSKRSIYDMSIVYILSRDGHVLSSSRSLTN